jgi:hypothetical protein
MGVLEVDSSSTTASMTDSPPTAPGPLAAWFAEGVRGEITELEKDGGAQKYEVLSGRLLDRRNPGQAAYEFIVADGTRIPEDASGHLKVGELEYTATVVAQDAARIQIRLDLQPPCPSFIPRGILKIDDTALLRQLLRVLEELAAAPAFIGRLATTVFHPGGATIGRHDLPETPPFVSLDLALRHVLEQACGSSLTYLWGPPGTGKTFAIAHLVAALVQQGQRVLVSSHTHAAVDQVLYATVASEGRDTPGPFAGSPLVEAGRVVRLGPTANVKIPDSVRFDKIVEARAHELTELLVRLQDEARPNVERHSIILGVIAAWDKLADLRQRRETAKKVIEECQVRISAARQALVPAAEDVSSCERGADRAKKAWIRRTTKLQRAAVSLQSARLNLAKAEVAVRALEDDRNKNELLLIAYDTAIVDAETTCNQLPSYQGVVEEDTSLRAYIENVERKIREIQVEIAQIGRKVLQEAQVVFCTLTRNYRAAELRDERFGAVVIDEISMALPPLVFLAASRASDRVVLVGDFLQLPPIVRSDSKVKSACLRQDCFHLAGVAKDLRPVHCPVLASLTTQRRMVPEIADVARHLVYGLDGIRDHADARDRKPGSWLRFLPGGPLLIVDTADFHCWSGKQPGSLSRFNLYSAVVAVEIAAAAARGLPKPPQGQARPIGIVTPYAAQRRLLSRLVVELNLEPWVLAGTVHTFQGNEADLVIFDAVLDEPYWSSRLTTPSASSEVLRDLNVAVTRARDKFVFLGSSDWLNKHAKPTSALGQLWVFLKDRSALVQAGEIVNIGLSQRVAALGAEQAGWQMPAVAGNAALVRLNETNFFQWFAADLGLATKSVFGLVPYLGEFRWPQVEPLFRAALARGVEVTLVMPPVEDAPNVHYVEAASKTLQELGAAVVTASGLHGKEIIIDERILYAGSLNWGSHRGRSEEVIRFDDANFAKTSLDYMQARYIRSATIYKDGSPRRCPECGGPVQVVNQRMQHGAWDFQPLKVGCTRQTDPDCKYLRNLDERAPFKEIPRCTVDHVTKYRRVRRGRGEVWQCPKHPRDCPREKVVPGDPK